MAKKILLVDDDVGIVKGLKLGLEDYGHQVVIASGLQSGIEALKQGPFDLVITDKDMPEKDAGIEMARAARAQGDMQIVLMSAGVSSATLPLVEGKLREIGGEIQFLDKMKQAARTIMAIANDQESPKLPSH